MADIGKDISSKAQEAQKAPQQARETADQTRDRVTRSAEEQKKKLQGDEGDKGENPAKKIGDKVKDAVGMGDK